MGCVWHLLRERTEGKGRAALGRVAPWAAHEWGFCSLGGVLGTTAYAVGVQGARCGVSQSTSAAGSVGSRGSGPRGAPGHVGAGMRAATGVQGSPSTGWLAAQRAADSWRWSTGVSGANCNARGAASGGRLVICSREGGGRKLSMGTVSCSVAGWVQQWPLRSQASSAAQRNAGCKGLQLPRTAATTSAGGRTCKRCCRPLCCPLCLLAASACLPTQLTAAAAAFKLGPRTSGRLFIAC